MMETEKTGGRIPEDAGWSESLKKAKEILAEGKDTCVLVKDDIVLTSRVRGVQPFLDWMADGTDLSGFSAADRAVGKAAAFLHVLSGIKEVYAPVISRPAAGVLRRYGIKAIYDLEVDAISNRTKTGTCPMELAVSGIEEPEEALAAVRKRLAELRPEQPAGQQDS